MIIFANSLFLIIFLYYSFIIFTGWTTHGFPTMPSQYPTRKPHQTAKPFRLDNQAPDSALLSPISPHCSHQPVNNIRREKKKIPFKDPSPSQPSETRAAVPRQPSESREFISCSIDPTISTRTRVKVQIAVASQTHLGWLDPISFKDDWEE